jgi:hypothetical protein
MTDEPTIDEISEDANLPATKRDITIVRKEIHDSATQLRSEMKEMKDEILHHFDVAVENIEDSLRGANADEISLLKTNLDLHEERIGMLEQHAGLR